MCYVLTLLLIRRRVFQLEEEKRDQGHAIVSVYCPRRDMNYDVPVLVPDPSRIEPIQTELAALLQ